MPFTCIACNYTTTSSKEYREHLLSPGHIERSKAKQKPAVVSSVEPTPSKNTLPTPSSIPSNQNVYNTPTTATTIPSSNVPPSNTSIFPSVQAFNRNYESSSNTNSMMNNNTPTTGPTIQKFIPNTSSSSPPLQNTSNSSNIPTIGYNTRIGVSSQDIIKNTTPFYPQNYQPGISKPMDDHLNKNMGGGFTLNPTQISHNRPPYYPQNYPQTYHQQEIPNVGGISHPNVVQGNLNNFVPSSNNDFRERGLPVQHSAISPPLSSASNYSTHYSNPSISSGSRNSNPYQGFDNRLHQYHVDDRNTNSTTSSAFSHEEELINSLNNLSLTNSTATNSNSTVSQHLNNWYCSLCAAHCNSKEKFEEHVRGSKHQKKQKTFYEGSAFSVYGLSQDTTQNNSETLRDQVSPPHNYQQPPPNNPSPIPEMFRSYSKYYSKKVVGSIEIYSCSLCNVDCNGPDVLLTHFNGKQHLKNMNRESLNSQYNLPQTSSTNNPFQPPPSQPYSSSNQSFYSNEYSKSTSPPFVADSEQPSIGQLISEGVVSIQKIGKQDGYICTACEMFCNSIDALHDHVKGRKHIKSYASFLAKNLVSQPPPTNNFVPINPKTSDEPEFDESRSVQILEYFWSQTFGQNMKPVYIETCYGPSHCTTFRCEIDLSSVNLMNEVADGKTKKEAKKLACTRSCMALDRIGALKKAIPPYLYNPSKK